MQTNRRKLGLVAGVILALALLAGLVWYRSPSEPSYGGRTLSEWLERYYTPNADLQMKKECDAAILNIGTNAVPYLLKWITYEASPRKRKLYERANRLLGRIHSTWVWRDKEEIWANGAVMAFAVLGPKADRAVDELSRITQQAPYIAQLRAIQALPHLGEKAVAPMLTLLTNADQSVRMIAISSIWPLGTNALPLLIKYTADSNKTIAYLSVARLGDLKLEPNLAVPALINSLDDSRPELRAAAINALRAFRNASRPAIPRLRKALADSDLTVRFAVTNLLRTLDPESLRKPAASNTINGPSVH